ncbi:uncharacterized protein [Centroberyx affinis]|uniref:uncharacterized protein isoform X2 n=1 Tax=Centroberyx affinis TaxID=166261 RepID=UPI003A5BF04F
MGCSKLLILGLVLNVAHCLEILETGEELVVEIKLLVKHNITAILGEEVYLSCKYLGENTIISAEWKRQSNSKKSKRLTGFNENGKPFSRDSDFSIPASPTNLTVKMRVSSVEAEGEYICVFMTEDEDFSHSTFLTVLARPDTHILVNEETVNGTHYQSVSCSAVNGRPLPQISWLVNGLPPSVYPFTVEMSDTAHPDGTATMSSILRFPTHLQDEDRVTCVVQHPTLPSPKLITVRVDTYVAPNVTIKAEIVQEEGREMWVVSCVASGGRPETGISLVLATDEKLQREDDNSSDIQTSSYRLPAQVYEGHNITCVFDHPKFTHRESRVFRLPPIHLSGVQLSHSGLRNSSDEIQDTGSVELQEGESDTTIGLKIIGNVPHYSVSCKKDDEALPEDVEVVGRSLTVQGPVEFRHAGLYECVASYHRHKAVIKFNLTVKPQVREPVLVAPKIRVYMQKGPAHRVIECFAADAVPAANMSWLLPEGVSGVSSFNFTSHNGSHSVRGVLLLPACSPWELTAECVINHPVFEKPENRSITLPICAPPNITIKSSTEWRGGKEYTVVECRVDSVAPAATITWHVGDSDSDKSISHVEETGRQPEVQAGGSVTAHSTVLFLSSLYSGQNLTCMMEHPSLELPEKREIFIPEHKASVLSVSVVRQQDSSLWLAVCDYRGEGVGANLAWILPDNTTGQTSLHSEYEGHILKTKLTYQFPLALHEGQDLICVSQYQHGITEKRKIHIPRYYISSVTVLNHTTPLQSRYGGELVIHRLALQEKLHSQRILLSVSGNVPTYSLTCQRSDGSFVQMEGAALVFQSEVTEQDRGLYTCHASFYHHKATVHIQVEVVSEDEQFLILAMICISSASAIILILVVTLLVFCKRNDVGQSKNQESLSALTSLMQDPCSPELKKAAVLEGDSQEYAQLVSYSIVIDVKTTV